MPALDDSPEPTSLSQYPFVAISNLSAASCNLCGLILTIVCDLSGIYI